MAEAVWGKDAHTPTESKKEDRRHHVMLPGLFVFLQKHGLKVYLRNPYSFTPMLEEGIQGKPPRSLLLGTDMAETQKQIAQFSPKDAQVQPSPCWSGAGSLLGRMALGISQEPFDLYITVTWTILRSP